MSDGYVDGGTGVDTIGSGSYYYGGSNVIIDGGTGNDSIKNFEREYVTMKGGDGYTLALANDVPTPSTNEASWTLNGTTATYKNSTMTAGYSCDGKNISYIASSDGETLITVTGVKSLYGISLNGKTITLSATVLGNKVSVGGGYEFDFVADYDKSSIIGSKGDDTIKVFGSANTITGGNGSDTFLYKNSEGKDIISGFGLNRSSRFYRDNF